VPASGFFGMR
uniref:Tachykinin-related peptide 7 n=1 Tax=Rhyparobia maderae TaxID=36963 RepID=TRP7_RHYMA|nr:RecName: Full=Tachykinin-related peptide 7; Short=LemTRP 7 [Rhyparobia maderae]